ncbi:MAG: aminopeptidase [Oscillospiraceae bacterium]|nr:aminopeptidase [Oscillospiraceae bacterium]
MQVNRQLLSEYARLIVRTGANVQPGQAVQLSIAVEQHEFAAMVTEEAYLAGAKKVNLNWLSDGQDRLHYRYADEETLSVTLPWEEEKLRQMTEDLPVRIFVESEDPDALAGLDPEKLSHVRQRRAAVAKPYRDAIDGKHQWCIAALPSEAWAKKCFPDCSVEEAMSRLWDAVLSTVRIGGEKDAVAAWQEHTARISEKSAWLNAQHFTSLRYESRNGTDFTVELIPEASWEGAGSVNQENGAYYIPNMPTEEIFTSPRAGKCEGTLVAVKPLSWNGQLIEDFSITFRDGKAVSCRASKGQALLEKMLRMDENACMLGEVALVPKESPVNHCGFLFYNTLFDENACCHFAVGQGFKEVLPDGDNLTTEEATARGINDSIIHVDFMVGAEDLNITGFRADGSSAPIFRDGTWAE